MVLRSSETSYRAFLSNEDVNAITPTQLLSAFLGASSPG